MVNNDYGKLAYLKLSELERKIQILENKVNESSYTELEFVYNNLTNKRIHTFSVTLNALKEGLCNIKILSTLETLSDNFFIEVKLNDVLLFSETSVKGLQNSYSLEATLPKGENVILVNIQDDVNGVVLNNLKVNVSGFVNYINEKNYISNVSTESNEYVLHLKNNEALLYAYSYEAGLTKIYTLYDVIDCKIAGVIDGVLYILYINNLNELFVCAYNLSTNSGINHNLNVSSCTSVAGYIVDAGIKIYYSKFAQIYSGTFVLGTPFYSTYTGRKGLEVYADSNAPNAVVIVDNFLNAKFVTD